MGMKETRLIRNLQKVSVSEGRTPAIALPETQLPPQIIIETTTERLNSAVLFGLLKIFHYKIDKRAFTRVFNRPF
jgi:hypothetical protein